MIGSFTLDVRYALRAMKANPAFTVVAVLSLALGIGANTAIFSLIDAVMLKYLPVQNPEELLELRVSKAGAVTNPIWEALRDRQDVFSGAFAWNGNRFNLTAGGESRSINGLWVSGDFFRTLGVGAAIGRTLTTADDRRGCGAAAAVLVWPSCSRLPVCTD
jgi:putative ABC transport system permease protein